MIFRVLLIVMAAAFAFAQEPAPETDTKKLAEEEKTATRFINGVCSTCHGADLIQETRASRQEWLDILKNMNGKGAGLSDQDVELLANYLTRKYPRE